jgi:hypothetical protein
LFAEQTIADTDAAWHRGVTAAIVAIAAVALGIWLQESYSKVVTVPWLRHILHRLYIWLAKSSYLRYGADPSTMESGASRLSARGRLLRLLAMIGPRFQSLREPDSLPHICRTG